MLGFHHERSLPRKMTMNSLCRRWLTVVLLLGLSTAINFLLDPYVSLTSQAMVYVLAVVVAAYKFDTIESSFCAIAAVAALNYFFVPPRWTFEIAHQEHLIALGVMLIVALVTSSLATRLRKETITAHLNEQRARQLQLLATELADSATLADIQTRAHKAFRAGFTGSLFLALDNSAESIQFGDIVSEQIRHGMQQCIKEAAPLGPGTGRWPNLEAWYLPIMSNSRLFGAACVGPAVADDKGGLEHAQALAALTGQAAWRIALSSSMLAAREEAHRQQVQSTLLAAISHDLRTPLATIVGAASSLRTQRDKLPPAEQDRLLDSTIAEANYLTRVTDNTLQLVRLSSQLGEPSRSWESLEEITGTVLTRVRQRDPLRRIQYRVQSDLPLVRADAVLLAQLIDNLLDNALKYSDGPITLTIHALDDSIRLCVEDQGPGIPEHQRDSLFLPYVRGDRSGKRGMGLGLALCRAIAELHQGQLLVHDRQTDEADNSNGSGTCFCLVLPVDLQQPRIVNL